MKRIGIVLLVLGIATIGYGYIDRVPMVLNWIYIWGEEVAWGIKIGLILLGGILIFRGYRQEKSIESIVQESEEANVSEEDTGSNIHT